MVKGVYFKVGWIAIFIVGISTIVAGIIIAIPTIDPAAEVFMGKSLEEIRDMDPKIADWIWHENKESIFTFILLGVAISSMTWNSLRKGERWSWYTVTVIVIGYISMYVIIHSTIGYTAYIPLVMVFLIAFVIGAILTIKSVYFKR